MKTEIKLKSHINTQIRLAREREESHIKCLKSKLEKSIGIKLIFIHYIFRVKKIYDENFFFNHHFSCL